MRKKNKILEEKYDFLIFSYNKSSQTKKLFKSSDIFQFIEISYFKNKFKISP